MFFTAVSPVPLIVPIAFFFVLPPDPPEGDEGFPGTVAGGEAVDERGQRAVEKVPYLHGSTFVLLLSRARPAYPLYDQIQGKGSYLWPIQALYVGSMKTTTNGAPARAYRLRVAGCSTRATLLYT